MDIFYKGQSFYINPDMIVFVWENGKEVKIHLVNGDVLEFEYTKALEDAIDNLPF